MSTDLSPLKVSGLTKKYAKHTAANRVNLELKRGEIFGLIGPEGAGKSTLIRTILGMLRPTEGEIKIFGVDTSTPSNDIMRVIGYLPEKLSLYEDMTGKQIIHHPSSLRKNTDREYTNTIAERLKATLDKPIKYLPQSEKQKIGIIQALMGKPELVILDEPARHLDPITKQIFYDILRQIQLDGRTVLLASSDLSEVQKICQRIGFIRKGELLTTERTDDIQKVNFREYIVSFSVAPSSQELANLPGVANFTTERNQAKLTVTGHIGDFLRELADYSVVDLESKDVDLENVFIHYYKQSGEERK